MKHSILVHFVLYTFRKSTKFHGDFSEDFLRNSNLLDFFSKFQMVFAVSAICNGQTLLFMYAFC